LYRWVSPSAQLQVSSGGGAVFISGRDGDQGAAIAFKLVGFLGFDPYESETAMLLGKGWKNVLVESDMPSHTSIRHCQARSESPSVFHRCGLRFSRSAPKPFAPSWSVTAWQPLLPRTSKLLQRLNRGRLKCWP